MFMKLSDRDAFGYPKRYKSAKEAGLTKTDYLENLITRYIYTEDVDPLGTWEDSANSNGGTLLGGAFVDSNGLNCDGVNSFCDNMSADYQFNSSDDFAFCFKIKITELSSSKNNSPIEIGSYPNSFLVQRNYVSGYFHIYTGSTQYNTAYVPTLNEEEFIVFTRLNGTLKLYANAVSEFSTSNTGSLSRSNLRLGGANYSGNEDFKGTINDFRAYNQGLTQDQVTQIYEFIM